MNTSVLILGGNLGKRRLFLDIAKVALEKKGLISAVSSVYETAAWGNTKGRKYLNQVVVFKTNLSASELMNYIHHIEKKEGRKRELKWADRTLDIDILFFNDDVINEKGLNIPHPRMAERRFVLIPLTEILPDYTHPVLGRKNRELLAACKDELEVRKFESI